MNYEDVALSLLQALHAEICDEHIEGIVHILEAHEKAINEQWEAYLTNDCNEVLFYEKMCCPICEEPIQIKRTRETINVEYEENV